ncbi:MAG TPA: PilZ domain-containing protein [Candidatus Acidoferrales bacterium]|nr:PilZ domain-containing protein [Candidatus Acidoferrales bacterium]
MDPENRDRRNARRFNIALPLLVRFEHNGNIEEKVAHTRDVSFRGVYFMMDAPPEQGSSVEIVLTLPQQITLAGEVRIRCFANILRVEQHGDIPGVAASIDRYEFMPAAA